MGDQMDVEVCRQESDRGVLDLISIPHIKQPCPEQQQIENP